MPTQNIGIAKDIVTIIGLIIAMFVGLRGLSTWQRQLKGTVEYELARRYLKAAFRVRDSLQAIRRSILIGPGHFHQAMKEAGYTDEQIANERDQEKMKSMVYEMWWKKVTEALAALEIEVVEAEVVWSKEYREIVKPLNRSVQELHVSISMWFSLKQHSSHPDYRKLIEKQERIIWHRTDGVDEYENSLIAAISGIEVLVQPHLKR